MCTHTHTVGLVFLVLHWNGKYWENSRKFQKAKFEFASIPATIYIVFRL